MADLSGPGAASFRVHWQLAAALLALVVPTALALVKYGALEARVDGLVEQVRVAQAVRTVDQGTMVEIRERLSAIEAQLRGLRADVTTRGRP